MVIREFVMVNVEFECRGELSEWGSYIFCLDAIRKVAYRTKLKGLKSNRGWRNQSTCWGKLTLVVKMVCKFPNRLLIFEKNHNCVL